MFEVFEVFEGTAMPMPDSLIRCSAVKWGPGGDNSTSPLMFRAENLRFCDARDSVTRYQFVNVEDFEGRGESQPTPYFYQNLGEAEYCVALFMYMHLGLLRQEHLNFPQCLV